MPRKETAEEGWLCGSKADCAASSHQEVGKGSGLEGRITSAALDKFCYGGWKVNQIEIFPRQ